MEAVTFLHHLKPSVLHYTFPNKHVKHFTTSLALANVAEIPRNETSPSASAPSPSVNPSSNSSLLSFQDFNEPNSLDAVKTKHAQMIKMSKKSASGDKIQFFISSYLEFQDFHSAALLFIVGFKQNYLCWNSFIKSFGGNPLEILEVFSELHRKGVEFDSKSLALLLKVCSRSMDSWLGLEIHACLIKKGLDLDVHLKSALMNFYGRCWGVKCANKAFYESSHRNESLLWNVAILINLRNEHWAQGLKLFSDMQHSLLRTNSFIIAEVLQACAKLRALGQGKQIHGYCIRNLSDSDMFIYNSLLNMYMKCNEAELARIVFVSMEDHDLTSWNSMIAGYSSLGFIDEAWRLFGDMEASNVKPDIVTWNCLMSGHFACGLYREVVSILWKMQNAGFKPNSGSLSSALQAISELQQFSFGKEIHCFVIRNGLDYDQHLGTSLLNMYVKNDDLINAQKVFDNMENRNIFAWNCVISGYIYRGLFDEALNLLDQMEEEGLKPDLVTYNILVSGYSTLGCVKEALAMIREMKFSGLTPNVVSWTSLVSGCTQNGYHMDALKYSIEMQKAGIKPNSATLASLLRACAGLSMLQKGKEVHCNSIRNAFLQNAFVTTALIDMYSKCGSLRYAYEVFQKIENKTLTSWNAMIGGLATYSLGKDAILLFQEMQGIGIKPDAITLTAVLSGCKNSGLINEAWEYFDGMEMDYGIIPTIEHYSCMVDLLGRAGYLDEAWGPNSQNANAAGCYSLGGFPFIMPNPQKLGAWRDCSRKAF